MKRLNALSLRKSLAGLSVLGLGACLSPTPGQVFAPTSDSRHEFKAQCRKLDHLGSYVTLRSAVRSDMGRIHSLLKYKDLTSVADEIDSRSKQIQTRMAQMMSLTTPDFTNATLNSILHWHVSNEQLGLGPSDELTSLQITAAHVTEAFNWQGASVEIKSRARLELSPSGIDVELVRPASLLEICQLQETIAISVELTLEDVLGAKSPLRVLLLGHPDVD